MKPEDLILLQCARQEAAGILRLNGNGIRDAYLLLMFQEKGTVTVNGRIYTVHPYSFIMYPFAEESMTISSHTRIIYDWMHLQISPERLRTMKSQGLELQKLCAMARVPDIMNIRRIIFDCCQNTPASDLCMHAVGLLLCLLMQDMENAAEGAALIPHYEKLAALRREIWKHPANSWYIQDICEQLSISRPYFHKIYAAAFGTTCTQDVIASRISYSKMLLETTDDAVSEISQKCGFDTDAYYMRQFKRHVGMTPTVYRRIFRQSAAGITED